MKKILPVIFLIVIVAVAAYFIFLRDSGNEGSSLGKIFEDTELGFAFDYPKDAEMLRENENIVSVFMQGPTQAEGTELFDGFSISFVKFPLVAENFEEIAQEEISQIEAAGLEITKPLEPFELSGLKGYSFAFSGLGEFTVIVLPFDESNYLGISYLVNDPGELGFQNTIDNIISSFRVL